MDDAWERVVALVVQPGVEFDNETVRAYAPQAGKHLGEMIGETPALVFEAHSTDYQSAEACAALIRDHFAILKVGPALTYAVREALFAMSHMEEALVPEADRARLPVVCERAMLADDTSWRRHCPANGPSGRVSRLFGFSDRIRYYWTDKAVAAAVSRLIRNLSSLDIPLPLLEQYMPLEAAAIREGSLHPGPRNLMLHHVMRVTDRYARACRGH